MSLAAESSPRIPVPGYPQTKFPLWEYMFDIVTLWGIVCM